MFEQNADFVARNNLISPFQSGFRPGFGFHTLAAELVSSYHLKWVSCDDDFSSLVSLVAGVPQGFTNSPLYFSFFIDDMIDVLEFSKFHMLSVGRRGQGRRQFTIYNTKF
jgi:hypothetical protein